MIIKTKVYILYVNKKQYQVNYIITYQLDCTPPELYKGFPTFSSTLIVSLLEKQTGRSVLKIWMIFLFKPLNNISLDNLKNTIQNMCSKLVYFLTNNKSLDNLFIYVSATAFINIDKQKCISIITVVRLTWHKQIGNN